VIHTENTDLVFISGGMTSYIEVLVDMPCKYHLKELYSEWLLVEDHVLTATRTISPV
jgi:hypothetical protein